MIEARCTKCGEVFNPIDMDDTEHIQCLNGEECGGQGIITGMSD